MGLGRDAAVAAMNRWEHHRVVIDGVLIHYLRAPGVGPNPKPLILTHGWPWTFWDFHAVIGPLSDPGAHGGDPADAFDVIVPSLPGFGFSTPLREAGIGVPQVADRWVRLMRDVLGYDTFCAHGGDWGAIVTSWLAHAHADQLVGAHMSLPVVPGVNRRELGDRWADDEAWMPARMAEVEPLIRSHVTVHTLDPQTLAYGLVDSPVGTAAWLWERRRNWSDCDGDVESVFSRDHLCTTAALYWCTGAIGSSLRLYHEHFGTPPGIAHDRMPRMEAPCAFAIFPKELVLLPRSVAEEYTDLRSLDAHGTAAATSPPPNNPTSWSTTCAPSSAGCEALGFRPHVRCSAGGATRPGACRCGSRSRPSRRRCPCRPWRRAANRNRTPSLMAARRQNWNATKYARSDRSRPLAAA